MKQLDIYNPFAAPVYYEETVSSTMDVSRDLARGGEPHGTVITAGFQNAGRGRIRERAWTMERGSNLPFTVLLRYPRIEAIPMALTLRTGLAAALAIEEFAPALAGKVTIKWPNDIVIAADAVYAQKMAGILTEADGGTVHIGIGVNVAQRQFPGFLRDKVTSIGLATNTVITGEERFLLLEKILACLYREIEPAPTPPKANVNTNAEGDGAAAATDWKNRIEARLFRKGDEVHFAEGAADSRKIVHGILCGIDSDGALLIAVENEHNKVRSFTAGELLFSYPACGRQE